jgi:hypothetical protein
MAVSVIHHVAYFTIQRLMECDVLQLCSSQSSVQDSLVQGRDGNRLGVQAECLWLVATEFS